MAGLKINSGKSLLFQPEITFLGYHFSKKGIKPHPDRVECLRKLPLPGDHKELRRVLGMFGFYQRCVPSYATVVHPLRVLLNADTFLWKEEHSKAFENLKNEISNCSELTYPHPDAAFTITADASSIAIGSCLHQVVDGESAPLAFFSRKLSEVEQRYSTFDRELLAAFSALKKWKDQISGNSITMFTDHRPLVGAVKN